MLTVVPSLSLIYPSALAPNYTIITHPPPSSPYLSYSKQVVYLACKRERPLRARVISKRVDFMQSRQYCLFLVSRSRCLYKSIIFLCNAYLQENIGQISHLLSKRVS